MYRVSVIMPVYNNEETLERAVKSILNQSMPGIELILINDGSTDCSAKICDTYAKEEPLLVEVIHQKHQGISSTLNTGLLKSSGKYVYFANPSDFFDSRLLESNVNLGQEKDADVVVFGFSMLRNKYNQETDYYLPRMPQLTSQYEFRNHFRNFYHFYPFEIFNKIYKRNYLLNNRLTFQKYSFFSERFFNLKVFTDLGSIVFNRGVYLRRSQFNDFGLEVNNNHFNIHRIFIQEFNKMIQYWGYETEYLDLMAEETYQLIYSELVKTTHKSSPLSYDEQIEHMTNILKDQDIKLVMENFDLLKGKTVINRNLLRYLKNENGKGAIDLFSRKKEKNNKTGKMKAFMRNLFD